MKLNHILLRNFRNYAYLDLDFDPGVNLLVGDNAQGKTNLLEAIVYLGSGRFCGFFRQCLFSGTGAIPALGTVCPRQTPAAFPERGKKENGRGDFRRFTDSTVLPGGLNGSQSRGKRPAAAG